MSKNLKSTIKLIMKPVIRLLLNSGVTYREFADTCKSLYVEVAAEGFGLKDRPTNTSRIAVLTGLDRKQIKAIRDQLESDAPDSNHSVDRVSRLLSGWHQDADFADAFGNPLALEEKSEDGFRALVKRYGGDIPPGALLKELIRNGAVIKSQNDSLLPAARVYIPEGDKNLSIQRSASVMGDLGDTLCHNLFDTSKANQKRFERRATNINISPDKITEFKAYIELKGQAFLEDVDEWLTSNESPGQPDNAYNQTDAVRLGVGLFWIESHLYQQKR